MRLRGTYIFTTVRTEGAILPADLLQRIVDGDKELDGLSPASYHLLEGEKLNEAINRSWTRLRGAWVSFKAALGRLPTNDLGTSVTRDRFLLPLFQELGYGRLALTRAIATEGKNYPISHSYQNTPIHLVGWQIDLDKRTAGAAGAARSSPHSLVQELLNRSNAHLWAFVSNGRKLRILRDNVSLTRQSFVEFDLEAMMSGEVYADFVLLWLLCHQSRVEAETPKHCWLEKWSQAAQDHGTRALEQLREGVEAAITALGQGFLSHPHNRELRQLLQSGVLSNQEYYHQLRRLVYRLLFLFVVEDRDALLDPTAAPVVKEQYLRYYSATRLRTLAERLRGTRHSDLFHGLRVVMKSLGGQGCSELGLPALGSFLWSDEAIPALEPCQIANSALLDAVRSLAFINDRHGRRPVDYKNLRSRELGSIYESLLELHPDIDVNAGTFRLKAVAGNRRKMTGCYYTPENLVQCLLNSALDPVLEEACRQPDPETAILNLKVCDTACGSGHFLTAAAHRMAKRLAAIRSGEEEPAPEVVRTALRQVIGRCIYGVDVNRMAVELCKVALWMEAMEPGKPLPFLEHHIQWGNSLLGATPALIAKGIPDEAFQATEGDDKAVCTQFRKQNRKEREKGQLTLVDPTSKPWGWLEDIALYAPEQQPWHQLEEMAVRMAELDEIPDESIAQVRMKQEKYDALLNTTEYRFSQFRADAWCAAFVWRKIKTFDYLITEEVFRKLKQNPYNAPEWMQEEIEQLHKQYHFFHWHVAFAHIFRVPKHETEVDNQQMGWSGGFDVILGNPPFVNAVEAGLVQRTKVVTRLLHPLIEGSADLAFYFFEKDLQLVNSKGKLGLVQPRPVLNSPASAALRVKLRDGFRPNLIYAPDKSKFFSGALVFTCLLVIGSDSICRVSRNADPALAEWTEGLITNANWWFSLEEIITGLVLTYSGLETPIDVAFEVYGSMTTGEAYEVQPFVLDEEHSSALKLVTTGLIDPNECFWGIRECRYLGSDYQFPRVPQDPKMSKALQRRLTNAHRPKILVAGLSRKIECFVDTQGEFIGAKSTFTILHPLDDIAMLEHLCTFLSSETARRFFISELGANAVGGGDIVMKKKFLQTLRFPQMS